MKFAGTRTVALSLLALPLTLLTQTASAQAPSQNMNAASPTQMVAAHGALLQSLDAKKTQVGSEFKIKLAKSVQLANGPALPSGTMLVGTIVQDDSSENGTAKLALRITHADLKNGQVVPIRATIVGVAQTNGSSYNVSSSDQLPNNWSKGTQRIDQMGVVSDVDLHSKVASRNSGVFVSTKKDNVKILGGTELQVAIAADSQKTTDVTTTSGNN